jgi:nucleoid DNA-binding protein
MKHQGQERQKHSVIPNLTKRDLVIRISHETGLIQKEVTEIIELMLEHLIEGLSQGQTIEFRRFGIFEVKIRKARIGRNPRHPENEITVPSRHVVKFTAGKDMKSKVMLLLPSTSR